ncbi:MAG: hypothetical protein KDB61_07170, partial [Planctomycetes bacterium]|nr:hypothetical protein [Planctomycetota bacterium]
MHQGATHWLTFAWLCLAACSPVEPAGPTPGAESVDRFEARNLPEGTVFLVEGQPITREEIDRWLPIYSMLEPAKSEHAIRRYILTNYNLPVKVGAVLDPEGREKARALLEETLQALKNGEPAPAEGPQVEFIQDTFKSEMGLDRWGMAKMTGLGEWS